MSANFSPPLSKIPWLWKGVAHHGKKKNTILTLLSDPALSSERCHECTSFGAPFYHISVIYRSIKKENDVQLTHISKAQTRDTSENRATNLHVATAASRHQMRIGRTGGTKGIVTNSFPRTLEERDKNQWPRPYSQSIIDGRSCLTKNRQRSTDNTFMWK